jgi:hypothetical protein
LHRIYADDRPLRMQDSEPCQAPSSQPRAVYIYITGLPRLFSSTGTATNNRLYALLENMNSTTSLCDDSVIGPSVHGCRSDFDFTLAFEQYLFSIVPSTMLLLAAPVRLAFLRRFRGKVAGNSFKYSKLVSSPIKSSDL